MAPSWQAFGLLTQLVPATQLTQVRPLQTRSGPQLVPGGFAVPSTQLRPDAVQVTTPSKQTPGLSLQAWPETHATQAPAAVQTPPSHEVPASIATGDAQVAPDAGHAISPR